MGVAADICECSPTPPSDDVPVVAGGDSHFLWIWDFDGITGNRESPWRPFATARLIL